MTCLSRKQERKKNKSSIIHLKGLRGSYTVEAAFLVPLIFFVVLFLLYLSFFLYDQCVVMQGGYRTALGGERLLGDEEQKRQYMENKYQEVVTGNLAGMRDLDIEILLENGNVKIISQGVMNIPVPAVFQGFWDMCQKQEVSRLEPVTYIRNCRKREHWTKGQGDKNG